MSNVGRIKLFYVSPTGGEENPPVMRGEIEYPDGTKDKVTVWANEHPRVTNGVYYTGALYTDEN